MWFGGVLICSDAVGSHASPDMEKLYSYLVCWFFDRGLMSICLGWVGVPDSLLGEFEILK